MQLLPINTHSASYTPKSTLAGWIFTTVILFAMINSPVQADEVEVIGGTLTSLGDGRYRIDATLKHADTGWDHYADRWDVLAEDGTVLGVRELAHPHVNEQPFTRSLTLTLPEGTTRVFLRANDSVHGPGTVQFELAVPAQ